MKDHPNGTSFLIPRHRRLTWDLLAFNRAIPLCGHDRICNLTSVAEARSQAKQRISWPAVFLKAYGLVAEKFPELRQTWYRWPIAHIYQHQHSVGILTVQREYKGHPWLFWGRITQPEKQSLTSIQAEIDNYAGSPPKTIFRDEIRLASLPMPVRRLIWGWNILVAKRGRAKRLGTFFLSTLAGQKVEIQVPPSIQTGCLTYGPLRDDGTCKITLAYDHRIMDGFRVAQILAALEEILLKSLADELLHVESAKDMMADVTS